LLDDVAVLGAAELTSGAVLNTDTIVAGVHFFPDDPPAAIAERVLRVNLSDLAAKGAKPLGYLLSLALSQNEDEAWIAGFAKGLGQNQQQFGWSLLGGDTVRTPGALTISVTALGEASPGGTPIRGGAEAGDNIWVSGTIGDGALGLAMHLGEGPAIAPDLASQALARFRQPEPRLALGQAIARARLATASADISDGLAADAGHIAEASGLKALIDSAQIPFSPAGKAAVAEEPSWLAKLLTGGDDYELVFTARPDAASVLERLASEAGVPLTRIGTMEAGSGTVILGPDRHALPLDHAGYSHF
jgi:thiamine-monophosphate kinase